MAIFFQYKVPSPCGIFHLFFNIASCRLNGFIVLYLAICMMASHTSGIKLSMVDPP